MEWNANKMGTNIESIQDAYQGFAKDNFTMLDNLKLGYGGTRAEAERLLRDAEKLTGVKYDINNLDDVFNAIHVIQEELGITGTTALEAEKTFTGSFNSMKASLENFGAALALGFDIKEPLTNLITTAGTFIFGNLLPMVGNIIKALPEAFVISFSKLSPFMVEEGKKLIKSLGIGLSDLSIFEDLAQRIGANISPLVDSIKDSFMALPEFLESVGQRVGDLVFGLVEVVANGLSKLDFSGIADFVGAILPALEKGLTSFIDLVGPGIVAVVDGVVGAFSNLWNALQPLLSSLADILVPLFEVLGAYLGEVFKIVLDEVANAFSVLADVIQFLSPAFRVLADIIGFLGNLLISALGWIGNLIGKMGELGGAGFSLSSILESAWNAIKLSISTAASVSSLAISTVINIFNSLKTAGASLKSALSNAWDSIVGVISRAVSSITGFIGRIKGLFSSLGDIDLYGAGRAIMDGFLNGLKSVWSSITGFIGGIAGWIRANKGPLSYDRKLLVPAGRAIIDGLNRGLVSSFLDVKKTISGMADEIYNNFNIGLKPLDFTSDIDKFRNSLAFSSFDRSFVLEDYRRTRDLKLESKFDQMVSYLKFLSEKDSDVYIDSEKASAILGYKIEELRERKERYENRRGGILV